MFSKMKKGLLGLCGVLLFGHVTQGQGLQQDPKLVSGVLKNGFHYYIYPSGEEKKESAIQLFVNAGSLQEEDSQRGLAHFVEHMAFNGSKNYPKNEVVTFLESLGVKFGADLNAHTSFDETVYKISIDSRSKENLHKALDIVYDWAFNLSFDSLEIEKERGIIIEEWRTKQGASARMSDQSLPLIFYNSRYADRQPIGDLEILRHFQRPTIVDFYQRWYRPELMAIAIVTNQDVKDTERLVKKLFGKAKNPKNAMPRVAYKLTSHQDTLFKVYTDKEAESIDFSYITKLPALPPLNSEANMLESMKRSISNALIKKRLERVAQQSNAYKSASMVFSDLLLHNGLSFGGAVLFEDHIEHGIHKFVVEKNRIVSHGFTQGEIDDFKTQYRAQLQRATGEKGMNAGLMMLNLKNAFFTGEVLMDRDTKRELSGLLLDKIDSADLQQHVKANFLAGNTVVLLSAPTSLSTILPTENQLRKLFAEGDATIVKPWTDAVTVPTALLTHVPKAGTVIQKEYIKEVDLNKWTLSNGAQVYLKKSNARKNHVQITGFRKGGFLAVDSSDYINALYAKDIIGNSGAGLFTRQALTKYLTGNSASAVFVLSQHREGLSASANMKDVRSMFELLHLKWTQPRVDTMVFNSLKKRALDNVRNKQFTITDQYTKAIAKAIGSDESDLQDVSEERLEKGLQYEGIERVFKSRFGSAKDFQFIVIGDYDLDSIQREIETYIGGLPGGEYSHEQRTLSYNKGPVADVLQYAGEADKATVNLFFQTTDIVYDYPEILKNELLENVLKVKLRKSLREEHSGVYGVGVSVSATSEPTNLFRTRINFTCESQRKDFLIEQALLEVQKIAEQPAYFGEELENAKVQMIQAYDKQFGKETFWSAELRNHLYFQFADWKYFTNYKNLVLGITAKDISEWVQHKMLNAVKVKAVLMPESFKNKL